MCVVVDIIKFTILNVVVYVVVRPVVQNFVSLMNKFILTLYSSPNALRCYWESAILMKFNNILKLIKKLVL